MAAVAGTFETHSKNARIWLLTYMLLVGSMVVLVLTILALGSTTMGTPNPRPQTGRRSRSWRRPPRTVY
jgi:biotin transporter BioY